MTKSMLLVLVCTFSTAAFAYISHGDDEKVVGDGDRADRLLR